MLDQTPWKDQEITQAVFEGNAKEDMTKEEFDEFFMETCKLLPDLPFTQLALASEGRQRAWEAAQKEEKKGK